jgi:hypothetical protein
MSKRSWVMMFFVLFAAAALSKSANADECAGCNGDCNGDTFFDSPVCGVSTGSCMACTMHCYFGLNGTECYCVLLDCSAGGERRGPRNPIAELRKAANAESLCRTAALRKKSYRVVQLEALSARS